MRVFILFLFLIPKAQAVNYDITVMQDYACFGVDGIPIPKDTAVASECCNNGYLKMPPSERCLAGFASLLSNSADNVDISLDLSGDDQELEKKFDGNKVDLAENPIINQTGPQSTVFSESVAAIAGNSGVSARGDGKKSGSTVQNALSALKSVTGFGNGSGSGSALGSSGSGVLDGASSAGASGSGSDAKGASDGTSGKDAKGGYARTGAGAGGSGDSSSGGSSKDRDASGSVAVNSRMGADVDLSDGSTGKDALGANGDESADADRDPSASATDPEDYFNRIDKTASIFKIVSNRYLKKKSLWKEGQKRPEDLKKKRI